jgi:hypothetical protein
MLEEGEESPGIHTNLLSEHVLQSTCKEKDADV